MTNRFTKKPKWEQTTQEILEKGCAEMYEHEHDDATAEWVQDAALDGVMICRLWQNRMDADPIPRLRGMASTLLYHAAKQIPPVPPSPVNAKGVGMA